jgi:hypothetical protein
VGRYPRLLRGRSVLLPAGRAGQTYWPEYPRALPPHGRPNRVTRVWRCPCASSHAPCQRRASGVSRKHQCQAAIAGRCGCPHQRDLQSARPRGGRSRSTVTPSDRLTCWRAAAGPSGVRSMGITVVWSSWLSRNTTLP